MDRCQRSNGPRKCVQTVGFEARISISLYKYRGISPRSSFVPFLPRRHRLPLAPPGSSISKHSSAALNLSPPTSRRAGVLFSSGEHSLLVHFRLTVVYLSFPPRRSCSKLLALIIPPRSEIFTWAVDSLSWRLLPLLPEALQSPLTPWTRLRLRSRK